MTVPTQPVTIRLADFGGPSVAGVTVTARLDQVDRTADGVFVSTKEVTGDTAANGEVVLNCFPNAVAPAGLGTVGSLLRVTAHMSHSKRLDVQAAIPDQPCNLADCLVDEVTGLTPAQLAVQQAQSNAIAAAASAQAAADDQALAVAARVTAVASASAAVDSETAAGASAAAALQSETSAAVSAEEAQLSSATLQFATKALMDADLAHAADTRAIVFRDSTASNNGEYYKVGASGAGSWAVSQNNRLAGIAANFTRLTSANIYDPNLADHYDDGDYNTNGSLSDLARFHRSGLIAVTPGQSIVVDLTATDAGWVIFRAGTGPNIHGYTGSPAGTGTFSALIAATFSQSDRLAIFTVPAGVNFIAFNARYPSGTAPDAAAYALMRSHTMVSVGAAQITFAAYLGPHSYVPTTYTYRESDAVALIKSGTDVYVKQAFSALYRQVRRLTVGVGGSTAGNGPIDEVGVMRVPAATLATDIASAYAAALPATDRMYLGTDNGAPEKDCGVFQGSQHGPTCFKLTKTAHGLTNAAVGDLGTDSAARSWLLCRVVDVDNIIVMLRNIGTATDWNINAAITGSTITFAGAGAFAFTANVQTQFWPALQRYTTSVWVDGTQITADGTYSGEWARVGESYGVPNVADWQDKLVAQKGTLTPLDLNDLTVQTQIEVMLTWLFGRYGSKIAVYQHFNVQSYGRRNLSDYFGGGQHNAPYRDTGETSWAYAPGLLAAISGYDLMARADITALAAALDIMVVNCEDVNDPMSHFAQFIKDSGGAEKFGFAMGYVRNVGLGVPAVRKTKIAQCAQISAPHKMYPHAVDWGAGLTAAASEALTLMLWEGFHDMRANPTHTVNRLVKLPNGKVHWIFDVHATLAGQWVIPGTFGAVPQELIGLPMTVLHKASTTTVHSDVMTANGARITTTGGYGRCVIEIG